MKYYDCLPWGLSPQYRRGPCPGSDHASFRLKTLGSILSPVMFRLPCLREQHQASLLVSYLYGMAPGWSGALLLML